MLDFPIIAEEAREIFKDEIAKLEKALLKLHPDEEKITCSVTITAKFRTYVIVDGKSVGYVSWSIRTGGHPVVDGGGTGAMPGSFESIIRKRYPGYTVK